MDGTGVLNHAYREHGADEDARSWQAREPSFKVSDVCRECNNGWMSDLERAAKRWLPSFMRRRQGQRINYANAPVLARWAAKTGLMFQACEPRDNRVVPCAHFQLLRNAEVLPPVMRMWIGAVKARGVWSRAFGGTFNLPDRRAPFYTVLLAVEQVTFMLMGSDDEQALTTVNLGYLGNAWTALWPLPSPAPWPPPYSCPAEQFPGMPEIMEALVGRQAPIRRMQLHSYLSESSSADAAAAAGIRSRAIPPLHDHISRS